PRDGAASPRTREHSARLRHRYPGCPATRRNCMTILGIRDSSYGMTPMAGAFPSADVGHSFAAPVTSMRAFGAPDIRRVVLRVNGDAQIVGGGGGGRGNAVRVRRE